MSILEQSNDGETHLHSPSPLTEQSNDEETDLHSPSPLTEQSNDGETHLHSHHDESSDTDIGQPMEATSSSLDDSDEQIRGRVTEQSEGSKTEQSEGSKTEPSEGVKSSAKALKETVVPTWGATNSLLVQSQQKGNQSTPKSAIVAPLLRRPPTDYSSLFTILSLAQGISAIVVGPHHKTVITLDLDLYERALKLQSSTGNKNWILRIGELYACFASLHAIKCKVC